MFGTQRERQPPEPAGYTEDVTISTVPTRDVTRRQELPFRITVEPLDASRLMEAVSARERGAIATFLGLVRDHNAGRRVIYLEYECYEPLALKAFARIAREAEEHWPAARLAIEHRVGRLAIGDISVVIATASPHRGDAFAACRYAIERLKQIAPIWKREHVEGGEVWIEGATADPDNEQARQDALTRACA